MGGVRFGFVVGTVAAELGGAWGGLVVRTVAWLANLEDGGFGADMAGIVQL